MSDIFQAVFKSDEFAAIFSSIKLHEYIISRHNNNVRHNYNTHNLMKYAHYEMTNAPNLMMDAHNVMKCAHTEMNNAPNAMFD